MIESGDEKHEFSGLITRIVRAVTEIHPGTSHGPCAPVDGLTHRVGGPRRGCHMG
jgi:hypothetical protein